MGLMSLKAIHGGPPTVWGITVRVGERESGRMGMNMGFELDTRQVEDLAPGGHFLALRIGFAFPMVEHNTLPRKWVEHYQARGLVMVDPVMTWLYANTGVVRWSEIDNDDPRDVMGQAEEFGLNYGVAISHHDSRGNERSFGSFARPDREFEDAEIEVLESIVRIMHDSLIPPANLTNAELEALGMVKNGLLMKEIADLLGVSEGAVKQRLKNAKNKLKAKNSTHAASMATSYGLI